METTLLNAKRRGLLGTALIFKVRSFFDTLLSQFRGITLERIVHMISSEKDYSWAGLTLSPRPSQMDKSSPKFVDSDKAQSAPDNKIIDFILSTCRSFIEPPVLLRVLLHR